VWLWLPAPDRLPGTCCGYQNCRPARCGHKQLLDAVHINLGRSTCVYSVISNIQLLNTTERFGTVPYRIVISCAISYCIQCFPQWPYRAITNHFKSHHFCSNSLFRMNLRYQVPPRPSFSTLYERKSLGKWHIFTGRGCPSCRRTNGVRALTETQSTMHLSGCRLNQSQGQTRSWQLAMWCNRTKYIRITKQYCNVRMTLTDMRIIY